MARSKSMRLEIISYLLCFAIILLFSVNQIARNSNRLYHQWIPRLPITFKTTVTILCLATFSSASHNPEVREDVLEHAASTKVENHQENTQRTFQEPLFNYQKSSYQQDPRKSRYAQQQHVDLTGFYKTGKIKKMSVSDLLKLEAFLRQNKGQMMYIPFEEPLALNVKSEESTKTPLKKFNKDQIDRKDTASSNNQRYIYIQPSILKNSFGLDSKVAQQILQKSAPKQFAESQDQYQISALQDLLGKNPNIQLEGLNRLLIEQPNSLHQTKIPAQSVSLSSHQDDIPLPNLKLGPNRNLEDIQKELDAVSQAQAAKAFAEAQEYAKSQVEAQHRAIALAQSKAQREALAKIAAQGLETHQPHVLFDNQVHQAQHELPTSYSNVHTNVPHVGTAYQSYAPQNVYYATPGSSEPEPELPEKQIQYVEHQQEIARPPVHYAEHQQQVTQPQVHYVEHQQKLSQPQVHYVEHEQKVTQPEVHYVEHQQKVAQPQVHYVEHEQKVSQPQVHYVEHEQKVTQPQVHYVEHHQEVPHQQLQYLKHEHDADKGYYGHSTPRPDTYHQIILETNQQTKNVKQIFLKKEKTQPTLNNDLQYASKYAFGYRILDAKKGNDFGHEEQRNGKSAKGHYHVRLPDGRLQKVEYYADDDGYHAKVTYENEASH